MIQRRVDCDSTACAVYLSHILSSNHPHLTVEDSGFIIHPQEGWIGASPDGIVVDPTYDPTNGILEHKCPYSFQDIALSNCCKFKFFYVVLMSMGELQLRRDTSSIVCFL